MVICVKCITKQGRKSQSMHGCPYNGNEQADKTRHAWMDYEKFIDELRKNLPPIIKERIVEVQKKLAEKQTLFNERMISLGKRRDELQAKYDVYCKVGLPRDVEKKKQREIRSHLSEVIGTAMASAIFIPIIIWLASKWIFPNLSEIGFDPFIIFIMIVIIVLIVYLLGNPVVIFLKAKRYAESQSQMLADELADEWCNNNGLDEAESNFEAEKEKWDHNRRKGESHIQSANRALVGSDEDLLNFYNEDNQTKNWYLEKIYNDHW